MPEVTIDVEVYCADCGEGLCSQTESVRSYRRGEPQFRVEACKRCLEVTRDEGYEEGYSKGQKDATIEDEEVVVGATATPYLL